MTGAVARAYHKLLAVKDEWEVARLFAAPSFQRALSREFEGSSSCISISAPGPLRGRTRRPEDRKGEAGPWVMSAFRLMARSFLRGTWLDPFRNERRAQTEAPPACAIRAGHRRLLQRSTPRTTGGGPLASSETIRGYGRVKEANAAKAAKARRALVGEFKAAKGPAGEGGVRPCHARKRGRSSSPAVSARSAESSRRSLRRAAPPSRCSITRPLRRRD